MVSPTIQVKKTDGSTVFMTMDEFQAYRNASAKPQMSTSAPQQESTGAPEHRSTLAPKHLSTGAQEHRSTEALQRDEPLDSDKKKQMRSEMQDAGNTLPAVSPPHELATSTPARITAAPEHQSTKAQKHLSTRTQKQKSTKVQPIAAVLPQESAKKEQTAMRTHSPGSENVIQWEQDDHVSLLEEPLDQRFQREEHSVVLDHRKKGVEAIIAGLPFSVPKDMNARLASLVESRLKDVRNDEQLMLYAMKPAQTGGLSLSEQQAKQLVAAVRTQTGEQQRPARKSAVLSGVKMRNPKKSVPGIEKKGEVASGMPASIRPAAVQGEVRKQRVHDIRPPSPAPEFDRHISPIDEIRQMTVTDLRRLGQASEAALRLKQKFDIQKEESFLDFLNMRAAWYQSPLFQEYIAAAVAALQQGIPVKEVLKTQRDLNEEDLVAAVSVSEHVRGG